MSPILNPLQLAAPLTDDELDELEGFLTSDATSDDAMSLDTLDGYLTAIVLGPTSLPTSRWMPAIWGQGNDDTPRYETVEQARRITELVLRHYNGIISCIEQDVDAFEPLLSTTTYPGNPREYVEGEMWAYGFLEGVRLCPQDWHPLFDDQQGRQWLSPLVLLGADEVTEAEEALTRWPEQREKLSLEIPAAVAAIYRFWLPYRQASHERLVARFVQRTHPKVGRNDPCPCGSGQKFKKCCGAAGALQ